LHDAFFKYASKPKLTKFGDVYYEGKEYEIKMRQYKPGVVSDRLRDGLGMAEGAPPPWLINMQRYGPPPSYPSLKIPGLNAAIPAEAEYGYQPGGWGKPPVDQFGNPLYGSFLFEEEPAQVDDTPWGEILYESSEDEGENMEADGNESGIQTPVAPSIAGVSTPYLEGITSISGLQSVGGATSVTSGLETPESVDLRKRGISTATPKPYTILQQQKAPTQPGALFQSNVIYRMPPHGSNTANINAGVGGSATPLGGTLTPFGSGGVGVGGTVTPMGYIGPGGSLTPLMGMGGVQTPVIGVTVSLNPSEMEQEGVFAGDVIRTQLKQHEEAAAKAKKAAHQVDPEELRKRKTDEVEVPKKKKKKEFKF